MGRISQGVLGGFSGKVGNVVGGSWKGIDYMRIKPASVANPRTQGQVDQRSKFSVVLNFLKPMSEFLRVGFKLYAKKMSQFNSAMSYNLNHAVTGTYPDFTIDYPNALVSHGQLNGAAGAAVASANPAVVDFTWEDNSGPGRSKANTTDKAMLLVYNASKGIAVYNLEGASRDTGAQSLDVPADFSGNEVQAFMAFISEDGSQVSDSVYVGSVAVA
jgi:hypothetical protein